MHFYIHHTHFVVTQSYNYTHACSCSVCVYFFVIVCIYLCCEFMLHWHVCVRMCEHLCVVSTFCTDMFVCDAYIEHLSRFTHPNISLLLSCRCIVSPWLPLQLLSLMVSQYHSFYMYLHVRTYQCTTQFWPSILFGDTGRPLVITDSVSTSIVYVGLLLLLLA